jgi:hypothetical protein
LFNHGFTVGMVAEFVWSGLAKGIARPWEWVTERSRWLASGLRTPDGGRSKGDRADRPVRPRNGLM